MGSYSSSLQSVAKDHAPTSGEFFRLLARLVISTIVISSVYRYTYLQQKIAYRLAMPIFYVRYTYMYICMMYVNVLTYMTVCAV